MRSRKHGGARLGAGRPTISGAAFTMVAVRIPVEVAERYFLRATELDSSASALMRNVLTAHAPPLT